MSYHLAPGVLAVLPSLSPMVTTLQLEEVMMASSALELAPSEKEATQFGIQRAGLPHNYLHIVFLPVVYFEQVFYQGIFLYFSCKGRKRTTNLHLMQISWKILVGSFKL